MKIPIACLVAALALGAAGCSALPAIRESAPVLSMDAPGSPEKTSACIVTEVTQAGPDVSVLRPPWAPPTSEKVGDEYRILLVSPGGSALAEVAVRPAPPAGSRVEARTKPWDSQDAFLEAVQRCGKGR
jgi:hypothetical protein